MQNILISGAASGIGAASARLFHRRGWRVGLLDIDAEALRGLAAELPGAWQRAVDVSEPDAVGEALELEWRRHGIRVADLMPPFVRTPMVAGQTYRPPVLRRLGLRLDAEDIAEAAWRQAHSRRVHRPVGGLFTALYWAGQLSPPWVNRAVMAWLSRDE